MQPPELKAVTVYVVVVNGVATTDIPEVVFNPIDGDQVYVKFELGTLKVIDQLVRLPLSSKASS